jgi:hypothetical protein
VLVAPSEVLRILYMYLIYVTGTDTALLTHLSLHRKPNAPHHTTEIPATESEKNKEYEPSDATGPEEVSQRQFEFIRTVYRQLSESRAMNQHTIVRQMAKQGRRPRKASRRRKDGFVGKRRGRRLSLRALRKAWSLCQPWWTQRL